MCTAGNEERWKGYEVKVTAADIISNILADDERRESEEEAESNCDSALNS